MEVLSWETTSLFLSTALKYYSVYYYGIIWNCIFWCVMIYLTSKFNICPPTSWHHNHQLESLSLSVVASVLAAAASVVHSLLLCHWCSSSSASLAASYSLLSKALSDWSSLYPFSWWLVIIIMTCAKDGSSSSSSPHSFMWVIDVGPLLLVDLLHCLMSHDTCC